MTRRLRDPDEHARELPKAPFLVHFSTAAGFDVRRMPAELRVEARKLLKVFGRTGKLPPFKGRSRIKRLEAGSKWAGWWRIAFGHDDRPTAPEWRILFKPNARKGWIRVDVVREWSAAYSADTPD